MPSKLYQEHRRQIHERLNKKTVADPYDFGKGAFKAQSKRRIGFLKH